MLFIKKKGNLAAMIVALALPVVIQQLLVNLLSITDTVMIGMIGEDAISAVTVANKFFFVFNLVVFGLVNGIGIFISQYYGAHDKANYNRVLRIGLVATLIVGVIGFTIMTLTPKAVVNIFITNQTVTALALEYNGSVRFSYIAFGLTQMLAVALRVSGNPRTPMVTGLISFVLNLVLNYLLIFGKFSFPQLGITGAALATTISRIIELILLFATLIRQSSPFYLLNKYGWLTKNQFHEIVHKTLPLVFNELIWSVSLSLIFMNYCHVDEKLIPAITVADQIAALVYVVFAGFATSVGVIIGNSLGANDLQLAQKRAGTLIKIGLIINIIGAIIIGLTSFYTPLLFSLSPQTTKIATLLLIIKCAFLWTQGYSETLYYIFRAGGDTKAVLFIDGLFISFGPLLLSYVFSHLYPLELIQLYVLVEGVNVFKIIIATHFYHKKRWVKNLTTIKCGGRD